MPQGGRGSGGGMPGGSQKMMRELQALQNKMLEEQQALGDETVEVSVGGGVVKVVMTGHQKLTAVTIDPDLLDPKEQEMLSDLLIAAVNQAVDRSQAMASERMNALTRGLNLPPGLGF